MPGGAGSQRPKTSPAAFSSRAGCSFLGAGTETPHARDRRASPLGRRFQTQEDTRGWAGPGALGPEKTPTAVTLGEGR